MYLLLQILDFHVHCLCIIDTFGIFFNDCNACVYVDC